MRRGAYPGLALPRNPRTPTGGGYYRRTIFKQGDSMSDITNFPLAWPVGRPRTRNRRRALFGTRGEGIGKRAITISAALDRLRDQVALLGAKDLVVSTNIPTRQDGLPFARARVPDDPGVAVYFRLKTGPHCLACDQWDTVAGNIAAIAAHIDAIRGQARWGVGDLAQAFAGYRALAAADAKKPWWVVLGLKDNDPRDRIRARFRELAQRHHPDRGGNPNQMAEITAAYNEAMEMR